MIETVSVLALLASWKNDGDGEAEKSRELTRHLLRETPSPFSRDQFMPGHLTATACVLHPGREAVLLVHHGRLDRWLLPGGHIERHLDASVIEAAQREAQEETGVQISRSTPSLVGIDVHGIPARKKEPFHLHHDLIISFTAESDRLLASEEVRQVAWCALSDFEQYELPLPIRRSVHRALGRTVPREL